MPKDSIYIWEISLTWKVKKPMHLEKRLKEAEKMWFKRIFLPECDLKSDKIDIIKVRDLQTLAGLLKA
jgi:predicted ATP-dependent serine protease